MRQRAVSPGWSEGYRVGYRMSSTCAEEPGVLSWIRKFSQDLPRCGVGDPGQLAAGKPPPPHPPAHYVCGSLWVKVIASNTLPVAKARREKRVGKCAMAISTWERNPGLLSSDAHGATSIP